MVLLALGNLAGCSEDKGGGPDEGSVPIEATGIIVNPKSPEPGDTVQLTVVLESDTVNPGDYPTIVWTASTGPGGFLENGQLSVRWVAPNTSQLVDIGVSATNTVNKTSYGTTIFVGTVVRIVDSDAGQIFLRPNGMDFVYLHTPDVTSGVDVYEYVGGSVSDMVPGDSLGDNLVISRDLDKTAYEIEAPPLGFFIEPVNIVYENLQTRTWKQITEDKAGDFKVKRRQKFTFPALSPGGDLIAYQGLHPTPLGNNPDTDPDTLDIYVYNVAADTTTNVTATHGSFRSNYYPSFSTDGNWLVFVSDRNVRGSWEYYGLPVNGQSVATDSAATVALTATDGQITSGSGLTVSKPMKVWNPVSPVMALVTTNGELYQMTMGSQGASLVQVTGVGSERPLETVWSADGSELATTDGASVYTVPAGVGTATWQHTAALTGDLIRDLTWSPDLEWLVYRVTRGQSSWFELLSLTEDHAPVVLTQAIASGEAGSYRNVMSTSSVYTQANLLIMLLFDQDTPSINVLDLAGAVQ
jgi:hypothetical protein